MYNEFVDHTQLPFPKPKKAEVVVEDQPPLAVEEPVLPVPPDSQPEVVSAPEQEGATSDAQPAQTADGSSEPVSVAPVAPVAEPAQTPEAKTGVAGKKPEPQPAPTTKKNRR